MKQLRYETYKAKLKKEDLLISYHLAMGKLDDSHLDKAKEHIDKFITTSDNFLLELNNE